MARRFSLAYLTIPGTDPDFAAGRGDTAMTLATIRDLWEQHRYLLDPHGAVGVAVARQNPLPGAPTLCLETAHPGKFPAAVAQAIGDDAPARHPALDRLLSLPLRKTLIDPELPAIEQFIRQAKA